MISIGDYNIGRGTSLQEEIDFGDDIHQETNGYMDQPANGYGGISQDLLLDHRQAIKA